jgi:hypothetical protein
MLFKKVLNFEDSSNSQGTNYTDSNLLDFMLNDVSDYMLSNCLSALTVNGNQSSTTSALVTTVYSYESAPFTATDLSMKPPNRLPESTDQDVHPFSQLLEALTSPLSSLTEMVWASDLITLESRKDSEESKEALS